MDNEEIILNNYSDDSRIKQYISEVLAPRVFHDIPINVLNTGHFSIINEYISQTIEQMAFTSSFYFNESFITKAVLPDSIYAEAAIFNIGYSFATPSSCNFLLELKIQDIYDNAVLNADTGLYEFILDKNTKFNLSNGNVYSLDYDILIQFKNIETSNRDAIVPAWNVQYINRDSANICAKNKEIYLTYRVTEVWLCILVQASEYERQTHVVVNNMTRGIPNEDKVIMCENHIAGFDVKYIDEKGNEQFLPRDHILPIHDSVSDNNPYVHYIMDNPQTIRFIWQLNGNRYFVPDVNSSFEITIYTCHGESANFTAFKNDEQPLVITSANKYSNNANVMKAAFVISGSMGGTNIGTVETVRRETIEAYNTANVISSDHDIDEWFKTFFFKNILYPFFFKRRDDPWGRIWSGYIALKDNDDYIFRTNTLHGKIPYNVLYNNADNTISKNEIIIPPGWIWTYGNENRYTVTPYTKGDGVTIENAKTLSDIGDKFIFSNPFGIRIQKEPFAIGYFNPWINQYITATKIISNPMSLQGKYDNNDTSCIYHASPIITNIKRTYLDDYYKITSYILPNISAMPNGDRLIKYLRHNAVAPLFVNNMWNYFKKPLDLFAESIPILPLTQGSGYIPFNPEKTYLCVREKNRIDDDKWQLLDVWIEDNSSVDSKNVYIPITGIDYLYGSDKVWGDNGSSSGYEVYVSGETEINLYPEITQDSNIQFERIRTNNYYEMRLGEDEPVGSIDRIVVGEALKTELTKYGESILTKIGKSYSASVYINIYFNMKDSEGTVYQKRTTYTIKNAANVYMPYEYDYRDNEGNYVFSMNNIGPSGIILYADMKPAPDSGNIEYYRIPFSKLELSEPMFYIANKSLPLNLNNMRVVLHTMMNGAETGYVEMQPVTLEQDGSYKFEIDMYPLTELVDLDNRINMASMENGGGSWKTINGNSVSVDASTPQIKISILIRSDDITKESEIEIGDSYTGFRIIDQYMLDDLCLIQELKEMRSVVHFGDSSVPTEEQIMLYDDMIKLSEYDGETNNTIYFITSYVHDKMFDIVPDSTQDQMMSFSEFQSTCRGIQKILKDYFERYKILMKHQEPAWFKTYMDCLSDIFISDNENDISWKSIYDVLSLYKSMVNVSFENVNVNGGVEIQLIPFVEYSLMTSERFPSFVSSFTQVHKAIEPVIFHRLEGNNYLDCKLIATYGLPHSYSSDTDYELDGVFWCDLNVQIEFDVKLFNQALATNTINELRTIIKSYFNRLTSIHTPVDLISMNNNIYISHVIQQMESHDNVAYMKFKGWYTNEKGNKNGNYMDANTQAIVQKWKKLEDMPTDELERYTPEMFILEDNNIVINLI